MRIAIPVWGEKVSPVLDTASRLLVVDVERRCEASRLEIYLDEQQMSHRCLRIRGLGVDLLVCGAVSKPFFRMLTASGIEVIAGISGPAQGVLQACLDGCLADSGFIMPGCGENDVKGHFGFAYVQDPYKKSGKRGDSPGKVETKKIE